MPNLSRLFAGGGHAILVPSFPAVTCPVQANMTTGLPPREHGVVANGFYWRDQQRVEMWTAWNDCIQRPQIWDILHDRDRSITSAAWFPLHSKGCGADVICTPAPVHNADGSESPWCFTRPERSVRRAESQARRFSAAPFLGPAGRHPIDGLDRRLRRFRRREISAELFLHLPAAPGLRRPKERPGKQGRQAGRHRTGRRDGEAHRRIREGLRRAAAVDRGQRVRHRAGQPRRLSQPHAARSRPA